MLRRKVLSLLALLLVFLRETEVAASVSSATFVSSAGEESATVGVGRMGSGALKESVSSVAETPTERTQSRGEAISEVEDDEEFDDEEESFYSTTSEELDDELLQEPIEATTYKAVQGAREEWRRRNASSGRSQMPRKLVEVLSDPVFWQAAACTFFVFLYLVSVQRQIYTLDKFNRQYLCARFLKRFGEKLFDDFAGADSEDVTTGAVVPTSVSLA